MLLTVEKAKKVIESYEREINDALLILPSCPIDPWTTTAHNGYPERFRLLECLLEIAEMRFGHPPIPRWSGFYSTLLWFDVFDPDMETNVTYRLKKLKEKRMPFWVEHDITHIGRCLRTFHTDFAAECETGKLDRKILIGKIADYENDVKNFD